ncbi:CD209 antigen-like isoform X2 [Eulemur rufifrons]|uniref:CD209 antigen-like isoform X2 n=1 Tax=Eulemur rufifrons TaxID=859984 RepID=UPI003742E530
MSDSKELGVLEEEQVRSSSIRFFARDLGSHQTRGLKSFAGCLGRSPLVLLFLAFMLLAVLLVTIVVQVSKLPSSLGQEQSRQEAIYQELTQLMAGVDEFPQRSKQEEIYQELTQLKARVDEFPQRSKQEEIYQELTQLKARVDEFPQRSKQEEIYQELTQLKARVDEFPQRSRQEAIYQELTQLMARVNEFPQRSKQEKMYQELTQLKARIDEFPQRSKQEEIYQELTQLKARVDEFPQRSKQEKMYQELTQLKAAVDHLCRPCPWDWTFFQGNCYFFSYSQRNWHDSITACRDVGAQLVVVKGEEEQNFLQLQSSRRKRFSWIGMSDLTHEGTWQWVDGSPLPPSLTKHWNSGEPNNIGEEDCVEIFSQGWNDHRCDIAKFWICKRSAASYSSEEVCFPSSAPAAPTQSAE